MALGSPGCAAGSIISVIRSPGLGHTYWRSDWFKIRVRSKPTTECHAIQPPSRDSKRSLIWKPISTAYHGWSVMRRDVSFTSKGCTNGLHSPLHARLHFIQCPFDVPNNCRLCTSPVCGSFMKSASDSYFTLSERKWNGRRAHWRWLIILNNGTKANAIVSHYRH